MSTLSRVFLKGLLTLLPIMLTVYLLAWITRTVDAAFGEPFRTFAPEGTYFPGVGLLIVIGAIFIAGILVNLYVTQTFVEWLEAQIQRLPVVKSIYNPLKEMTNLFANSKAGAASQKVVLVQMPGMGGLETLGLVTRDQFNDLPSDAIPEGSVAVFIPFSYGVGGFTVIVPKTQVRETTIPAEKAMQLAITGWIKSSK